MSSQQTCNEVEKAVDLMLLALSRELQQAMNSPKKRAKLLADLKANRKKFYKAIKKNSPPPKRKRKRVLGKAN